MKAKDLRERSAEDLKELEKSLRVDTFQNRLKNFTNRLDDTSVMNKTKRELARVITLLAEKTRAATPSAADVIAKPKKPAAPKAKAASASTGEAKAKKTSTGQKTAKKTAKKDEAK
jgi:large subunit ribosomal protein L29